MGIKLMRASNKRRAMQKKRKRKKIIKFVTLSFCGLALITTVSYFSFKTYMADNMPALSNNNENVTALSKTNKENKEVTKPTTNEVKKDEVKQNNKTNDDNKVKVNEDNKSKEKVKDEKKSTKKIVTNVNLDKNIFDSDMIQAYIEGSGCSNNKKVAFLTFDDGPSLTNTPNVLKVLGQYGVKGTFFVLGSQIDSSEASKNLLRQIYNGGHGIGNHGYSHRYDIMYPNGYASGDNCIGEFDKSLNSMRAVLGQNFNCSMVRFPGGHMSWKGMSEVQPKLDDNGYKYIDWNCVNGDSESKKRTPDQLLARVKECYSGQNKLVVLMHDTYGKENTVEILPKIIEFLQHEGYEFGTLN